MYRIYSHRGNLGSLNITENVCDNSIEGVKFALQRDNVYGIELDFRRTKDLKLATTHDKNMKHISLSDNKNNMSDMTLKEITNESVTDIRYYYKGLIARAKALRLANIIGVEEEKMLIKIYEQKLDKTSTIVSIEDMLDYIVSTGSDKEILLELKDLNTVGTDIIIDVINNYKNKLNLAFHTYDLNDALRVKEETGIKTGLLTKSNKDGRLKEDFINNVPMDFYSILWVLINKRLAHNIINNSKELNAWTVDTSIHLDYIKKIVSELVIDPNEVGIITNIPDLINERIR